MAFEGETPRGRGVMCCSSAVVLNMAAINFCVSAPVSCKCWVGEAACRDLQVIMKK